MKFEPKNCFKLDLKNGKMEARGWGLPLAYMVAIAVVFIIVTPAETLYDLTSRQFVVSTPAMSYYNTVTELAQFTSEIYKTQST